MAAYIRNNNPTIVGLKVVDEAGIAGGVPVKMTNLEPGNAQTATATLTGADAEHVYLTVNVRHDWNIPGDDATAVIPEDGYIAAVHPQPNDEFVITVPAMTSFASATQCYFAANGTLTAGKGSAGFGLMDILDKTTAYGQPALHVRVLSWATNS